MGYFIRGGVKPESANPVNRFLIRIYRPVIELVLRKRWQTIAIAAAILVATILPWSRLGSEFMPPLNEGDMLYMPSGLGLPAHVVMLGCVARLHPAKNQAAAIRLSVALTKIGLSAAVFLAPSFG